MTIYKYPLMLRDMQIVTMPLNAKILTVQFQHGDLCLWALVEPNNGVKRRVIEIFSTGNPINKAERNYIGTVQQAGGSIWHVFEIL